MMRFCVINALKATFLLSAQISDAIQMVCKKERVYITDEWQKALLERSEGNLRRALCLLEASAVQL
jgi:DNA polymerase III delta prime subunit